MVSNDLRVEKALGALTVLLLAVGGLAVVKWIPYYDKALLAFTHHSIGSIPSLAMLRKSFPSRLLLMVSVGVVLVGSAAGIAAKMHLP
jgi:hypothetical protein